MKIALLLFIPSLILGCVANTSIPVQTDSAKQDLIIQTYLVDSAHQYSYDSPQWAYYIDKALAIDSTIAYAWQQKAMPYFKSGKYELGMSYLDKAVHYDKKKWLSYRAFIKCIFSKNYKDAIEDFQECIKIDGNSYVMDHSYLFYIALSKIQLNQFSEAADILNEEILRVEKESGKEWVHHLVSFYYGIALYEQQKYTAAINAFDNALIRYPNFSDAQYYKAISLFYIDAKRNKEQYSALYTEAIKNLKLGYTINEDNAIYERYPYQLRLSHFHN